MTDSPPNVVVLAEAGMRRLKELRALLSEAGVEAFIVRPPSAGNT